MDLADCRTLLAHAEWADALIWKSVLAAGAEDADLREKLHHLHMVQEQYLRIWRQRPVHPPDLASFPTLAALGDWARGFYRELPSFLDSLLPGAAAQEVRLPWADHLAERFEVARPVTWAETVLQVVMHSGYHRGQVARRLRELGAEPPLTDFIAWIWMGRPAADWTGERP